LAQMLQDDTDNQSHNPETESPAPVRIVLAGAEITAVGLRHLLEKEADMEVVATASNTDDAVRYVTGHKPDVLLVDALERGSGKAAKELTDLIAERSPGTEVVFLTHMADPLNARDALRNGVNGYVLKEDDPSQLLAALRHAAGGKPYLSPKIAVALAKISAQSGARELTDREVEVLRLVGLGHTNAEIGEKLHLSVRTIESHRAHLQEKLDVYTRAELVRVAIDRGLVG